MYNIIGIKRRFCKLNMTLIKNEKINKRLEDDFNLVTNLGYTVVGVFLQGSQNYDLDYDGSDIDTKAIVLPTFKDIILNRKPISTTHILKSNEHIDIKDIRLMFDCFKKQNINFIEILFTKYFYLNPEFASLYQPMLTNAESIAHYNNYAAVNCIVGMILEKRAALCHPYPSIADRIEKYGYDRKQLHHILRCYEFLNRYISGESYEACLHSKNVEFLKKVKSDPEFISLEDALKISDEKVNEAKLIKNNYMKTHEIKIDKSVEELFESVLYNILKRNFEKEFKF